MTGTARREPVPGPIGTSVADAGGGWAPSIMCAPRRLDALTACQDFWISYLGLIDHVITLIDPSLIYFHE
jgi:hypothetical protein